MKTCTTCAHYAKDPSLLGEEHCLRTASVKTAVSPVDGQTRETIRYERCEVERMGGGLGYLLLSALSARWCCGRHAKHWVGRQTTGNTDNTKLLGNTATS